MGGGESGGGSQNSTTQATIAPELQPLFSQSGQKVMEQQTNMPLSQFNTANPMQVAPRNATQNFGASLIPSLASTPQAENMAMGYAAAAPWAAGRTATGEGIATNPAIQAQVSDYYANTVPQLESQYALQGLGRSSALGTATAKGLSSMLPSLYESELGREQQSLQSQASMLGQMVPQLEAIGQGDTARTGQAITAAETVGGAEQQSQQAQYTSEYQDFLRQQALAEEALYTPFGALVPSGAIGQVTSGSSKQSGGGLFK